MKNFLGTFSVFRALSMVLRRKYLVYICDMTSLTINLNYISFIKTITIHFEFPVQFHVSLYLNYEIIQTVKWNYTVEFPSEEPAVASPANVETF